MSLAFSLHLSECKCVVSTLVPCGLREDVCRLQNELAILEFIHCLVETLDRYFSNVCELDLMFSLEQVSMHNIPSVGQHLCIISALQ